MSSTFLQVFMARMRARHLWDLRFSYHRCPATRARVLEMVDVWSRQASRRALSEVARIPNDERWLGAFYGGGREAYLRRLQTEANQFVANDDATWRRGMQRVWELDREMRSFALARLSRCPVQPDRFGVGGLSAF